MSNISMYHEGSRQLSIGRCPSCIEPISAQCHEVGSPGDLPWIVLAETLD